VRDARSRRAEARHLARVEVHAMREPHVVAEPAELLQVLDGAHAEALQAEGLLVERLGKVRVQAHPTLARERRRLGHQLARDREGRARRERDPHHRARRRIVEAVQGGGVGREDRVSVLDDRVGRQPTVRDAEVHRAAARVEADAELARRLDLDRQQVARVAGEDIVVVRRRRTAGAQQRREACARRSAQDRGVDPRPHRIQLDQPLEQRRLLRAPAGRPLIEVVVAVDEPRRGEAAGRVEAVPGRPRAGSHRDDPVALDGDVAVGPFVAGDGGDGAALDDQRHARAAASRTASRIFS
jgi:hypothetical protein